MSTTISVSGTLENQLRGIKQERRCSWGQAIIYLLNHTPTRQEEITEKIREIRNVSVSDYPDKDYVQEAFDELARAAAVLNRNLTVAAGQKPLLEELDEIHQTEKEINTGEKSD